MWNVVFVKKVVELVAVTIIALTQHAIPGKLAVAAETTPTHDQRVHDRLADGGNLGKRTPEFRRGDVKYFRFIGRYSRGRYCGRSLQHGHVTSEVAFARCPQDLFGAIALRENFYFATKHNDQAKIALTGFEKNIPAFHRASLRNRFQQRQLMILELRESDAFRVAIKLFVLLLVSHMQTLRAPQRNPNPGRPSFG
jgi:hypothetical protein